MKIIILVVWIISSSGCASTPAPEPTATEWPYPIYPTEDYSSRIRDLQENQAKWESQQITHYQMTVDGDLLSSSLTIEVKDGSLVSAVNEQGEKVSSDGHEMRYYPFVFSIPALFDYISQTYAEIPPSMAVDYDPTLGYPVVIHVDPFSEPCCQDFSIYIQDFHILSP